MTSQFHLSYRRLPYHRERRALVFAVAVSITVLTAVSASWGQEAAKPGTASGDPSSSSGHLVYSKLDRGGWQVWETDMAAKTSKRLTTSARDKRNPSVDTNGDVVFHTVNQTVYRIRNGVEERILTDLDRLRDVEWNPIDGRLAMVRIRRDVLDMMHVWTAGSASNDKKRETGEPRVEAGGAAKQSDVAPRLLTREPGVQCHPSWSPDGKRLAFVSGHGWGCPSRKPNAPRLSRDRRSISQFYHVRFEQGKCPTFASIDLCTDVDGHRGVEAEILADYAARR